MKVTKHYPSIVLLFVLTLLFVGCNKPVDTPVVEPTVTEVNVVEYQDTVYLGEVYDESSVKVEVKFSDNTTKMYSGEDLLIGYNEFDAYTEGEYKLMVRIIPINKVEEITVTVSRKTIKILMIANSFGDDTVQWVHEIGEDLGYDFTIANLYIGGCTLETHLSNLNSAARAYEYVTYKKSTKTWNRIPNTSIQMAMEKEDWDYISLQQGSWASGLADTYDTINTIMDGIIALKSDVKFLWNMTWAYQTDSNHSSFHIYGSNQMTMYNQIVNAVKTKVVPNDRFVAIIPNGTAVQNARTSFVGDTLCRDIYCHLTLDFGRYIAGLTLVSIVTGEDISSVKYSPNLDMLHKAIAIESVVNAISNPFEITNSKYE